MFIEGGPIKVSINIVRNTEDPCGFGWIRSRGVSPLSMIVTKGEGTLKYKQKVPLFQKCLLGTDLKLQSHVEVVTFHP